MNKIHSFLDKEFGEIRTVVIDSEVYFASSDVARVLGHERQRDMIRRLEEDESVLLKVMTQGGTQEMSFVTESGFYHTIFISRKPVAKKFRRWVTSEVLPQIRKTGGYFLGEEELPEQEREELATIKKTVSDWISETRNQTKCKTVSTRIGSTIYDVEVRTLYIHSPEYNITVDREGRILSFH